MMSHPGEAAETPHRRVVVVRDGRIINSLRVETDADIARAREVLSVVRGHGDDIELREAS